MARGGFRLKRNTRLTDRVILRDPYGNGPRIFTIRSYRARRDEFNT